MKVYALKSCDTCRKTVKALLAARDDVEVIDIRADGLPSEVITDVVKAVGWEAALNRRSTTWRGLDDADKADVTTEKAIALITKHPTLLKRPAITDGKTISVGWTAKQQDVWL
jgi:Spx/MgsR family transcriptional regulator